MFGLKGKPDDRAFDWAFFGDVHKQQMLGDANRKRGATIWYPGSPWAQNWSEQEKDKGCLYVDIENDVVERLPVHAPMFWNYQVDSVFDAETLLREAPKWNEDFVKINVPTELVELLETKLADRASSLRKLQLIPYRRVVEKKNKNQKDSSAAMPVRDLMKAYLDTISLPEEVSKDYLMKVGDRILKS
jgi:DNA repair exonuclease SbcCD nuclease subunit